MSILCRLIGHDWILRDIYKGKSPAYRPVDLMCGACDSPQFALGVCRRHYDRSRKIGTQARAQRAYTGTSDYGKIYGRTEYSEAGDALTSRPLAQTG